MQKLYFNKRILLYSPLLLCVLVMLPRLLSPQFGFFDDASALIRAQQIWAGQWNLFSEAVGGRFRPVYWLFYALLYGVFGKHPFGFFLWNTVLFLIITFLLIRLALALHLGEKASFLVGLTFVVAGPVLENVYTLCKLELLQAVWILFLLSSCGLYVRARKWYWKTGVLLLMAGLVLLTCGTKETGVLLLPASLISLLISAIWYFFKGRQDRDGLEKRIALFLASLIGVIGYFILSSIYLRHSLITARSDNFSYDLFQLNSQIRLFIDWMLRDYLYLIPIGALSLTIVFKKNNGPTLQLILECAAWGIVWVMIYFPWLYFPEYYLLPLALAAALICGVFYSLLTSHPSKSPGFRYFTWGALGLSGLLLLLTLPNQITNAHLQLSIDRANAKMLAYVVEFAPRDSKLWINIQEPNEYVTEFQLWVNQIDDRQDLQVDYFHKQDLRDELASGNEIWIVSPYMENQFYPSVRMGVYAHTSRAWNEKLKIHLNGESIQAADINERFLLANIDVMRFFCPVATKLPYCQVPSAPLDRRLFTYGWIVERVH
jgi:hypothetical protein